MRQMQKPPCGPERLCRNTTELKSQGSFAEYLCIPEDNIIPLPDDIPDETLAFLDPPGNAMNPALSFNLAGEGVLVKNSGSIGIIGALTAKRANVRKDVITDIAPLGLKSQATELSDAAVYPVTQAVQLPILIRDKPMLYKQTVHIEARSMVHHDPLAGGGSTYMPTNLPPF